MRKKKLNQLTSIGIYSHKKAGLGLQDLLYIYDCAEDQLRAKFKELNPDNGEQLFEEFKARKVKTRAAEAKEEVETETEEEVKVEAKSAAELSLLEREEALSQELIENENSWNRVDKEYRSYRLKLKDLDERLGEIQKELKKLQYEYQRNLDRVNSAITRRNELSDEHTLLQREISVVREQIDEARKAARLAKKVTIYIWENAEVEFDTDMEIDISGWAAEADKMVGKYRTLTFDEMDAVAKAIMAAKHLREQDIPFCVECESHRVKEVIEPMKLKLD